MIYLIFAIISSSSIALILKFNSENKRSTLQMLAANYLSATLIAGVRLLIDPAATYSNFSLFFGMGMGLLFALSFFAYAAAVKAAGTSLATTASRLSLIIPFLLSALFYAEKPGLFQYFGFIMALFTIGLFYYSLRHPGNTQSLHFKDYIYLLLVLIGIGLGDSAMKIFKEARDTSEEPWFIFFIFSTALLYILVILLYRKETFDSKATRNGLIMGIPNMFSTFFLLGALARLPAVIVYPFNNIAIILFTTIMAYLLWHERLNLFGKLALSSGIIALILLSM